MSKEVTTRISPESIEIANAYLEKGDINAVSTELKVPRDVVSEYLNKREVKKYIDSVYLDAGYRNRFKLAEVMDTLIYKKQEEFNKALKKFKELIEDSGEEIPQLGKKLASENYREISNRLDYSGYTKD